MISSFYRLSISSLPFAFERFFGNKSSIDFNCCLGFKDRKAPAFSPLIFKCLCLFFETFPRGEYVSLTCSTNWLWLRGNISLPVRYSHLLILSDGASDIFSVSLLILCFSFSSLILSSSMWLLLIYYARVVPLTKKAFGFTVDICKDLWSL